MSKVTCSSPLSKLSAKLALPLLIALCLSAAAQVGNRNPNELARSILNNEIKSEAQDQSHWMFRLSTEKAGGGSETDEVVETKDGDLRRPLLINGRKTSDKEANRRVQQLAHDSGALHRSLREKNEDTARSQRMLKMLPDAFVFQYGEAKGNVVELKFSPNPKFKPPSHEAQVFHAMQGSLWLDTKQSRLQGISGRLMYEVKFGGGFLGHLDPGGTFEVKQAEVAPGYWELTLLNVHMKGKALFFKTIAVQQRNSRTDFKRIADTVTAAKGAEMLLEQTQAR